MVKVRKTSIDQAEKFQLPHKLWGTEAYKPNVYVQLAYDDEGITVRFTVDGESNPLRNKNAHFSYVHEDSCVEWFVNFLPEKCDRYFNFEVNANGVMNVSFRKDRYDKQDLSLQDIAFMEINTSIHETYWTVSYKVPFDLIRKYIPEYRYRDGMKIRTNFYKCGDHTEYPHYGVWNAIPLENPDFHQPDYFGEVVLG